MSRRMIAIAQVYMGGEALEKRVTLLATKLDMKVLKISPNQQLYSSLKEGQVGGYLLNDQRWAAKISLLRTGQRPSQQREYLCLINVLYNINH